MKTTRTQAPPAPRPRPPLPLVVSVGPPPGVERVAEAVRIVLAGARREAGK